jgi:CHAD domain-containing protein
MPQDPAVRIVKLQAALEPLSPEDSMAEAGRKVLLGELVKILSHETGSRTDRDLEDVHHMRVAMRRTRSLLRLLRPYFKKGVIRRYNRELANLAAALGEVRDLDILVTGLHTAQPKRKQNAADFQALMNELERQRLAARQEWVTILDSRDYQRFLKSFAKFLTSPGRGGKSSSRGKTRPSQSRHVLPSMIYDQLAAVLAFETVLDNMNTVTFHNLRIAFKRLRYLVSLFEPILGKQIEQFIEELKQVQDCLGEMHDCITARDYLLDLPEEYHTEVLSTHISHLEERESALRAHFFELWSRFNTRRVQQQLASAIVGLR